MNAQPKAYQLNHPELNVPVMAEIVGYWYKEGRAAGQKLQFPGEQGPRCLTYDEIRALQEEAIHEPTPA